MNICREKWQFSSIVPKFSQIWKIISNIFADVLLEQIIIDKYTVGILNNIDIYENIVTFVHISSSFNEKITLIDKINIVIFMVWIWKIPTVKMKSRVVPTFWYKDKIVKWQES